MLTPSIHPHFQVEEVKQFLADPDAYAAANPVAASGPAPAAAEAKKEEKKDRLRQVETG